MNAIDHRHHTGHRSRSRVHRKSRNAPGPAGQAARSKYLWRCDAKARPSRTCAGALNICGASRILTAKALRHGTRSLCVTWTSKIMSWSTPRSTRRTAAWATGWLADHFDGVQYHHMTKTFVGLKDSVGLREIARQEVKPWWHARGHKVGPGRLWTERLPDGWTQAGREEVELHASGATVEDTGDAGGSGGSARRRTQRAAGHSGVRADALAREPQARTTGRTRREPRRRRH